MQGPRSGRARQPVVISCLVAALVVSSALQPSGSAQGDGWKTTDNDRLNRYEGFIAEDAANPEWELLSFTGAKPPILENSLLRVAFYLPATLADSPTSTVVVARELDDREHYRMESKPEAWAEGQWSVFQPWPTADAIDRRPGIRGNLGVVVFPQRSVSTATNILPAFVAVSGPPLELPVQSYHVVMKSSRTLSLLTWRLERVDRAKVSPLPEQPEQDMDGDFIRGVPIELSVPAPRTTGLYRLTICATPRLNLKEFERPAGLCRANDIERSYTFHHMPTATVGGESR